MKKNVSRIKGRRGGEVGVAGEDIAEYCGGGCFPNLVA